MSHEENYARQPQDHAVREFPVTSGWNAFDVWWTRVRVRWVAPLPEETHTCDREEADRGDQQSTG